MFMRLFIAIIFWKRAVGQKKITNKTGISIYREDPLNFAPRKIPQGSIICFGDPYNTPSPASEYVPVEKYWPCPSLVDSTCIPWREQNYLLRKPLRVSKNADSCIRCLSMGIDPFTSVVFSTALFTQVKAPTRGTVIFQCPYPINFYFLSIFLAWLHFCSILAIARKVTTLFHPSLQ